MRKPKAKILSERKNKQVRRKLAIRKKITGTAERPRLCVVRSNKHLSVQVIDDTKGVTLFHFNTYGKDKVDAKNKKEAGQLLGNKIAEKLKEASIASAVFDRNGRVYAGVLTSLADSIRENGIKI